MMTFIGIALILVGIGLFILKKYNDSARKRILLLEPLMSLIMKQDSTKN